MVAIPQEEERKIRKGVLVFASGVQEVRKAVVFGPFPAEMQKG